jgi:site-specific DNA-methyltransferase (adenine-specific)
LFKSGHVSVKDIRELSHVISRQNAAIGLFLTLEEPTSDMVKEVKAAEPYVLLPWKQEYPKIQILTIEEMLHGKKPDIPPTRPIFQEATLTERITKNGRQTLLTE